MLPSGATGSASGELRRRTQRGAPGAAQRRRRRRNVFGLDIEAVTDQTVHEGDGEEAVVRARDPSRTDGRQGGQGERIRHHAVGLLGLTAFRRLLEYQLCPPAPGIST